MLTCARCGAANPEGFRFCGNCAAPLVAEGIPAAERRKVVTILFCDVAGSTGLGERLDPETMRAVMGRYFETLRTVLERHGGTVEKFIGDAVMAVFGHPVLHEDDALRAVRAAAELRASLAELNVELERDWGVSIRTRTGINTGQVVAGEPGSGETLVTGDAVNVAARLQTAAEEGETLVGDETYELVRDAVSAEATEPLTLKGKESPVRAWRLGAVTRDALGHARRLDSPLVGRRRERQLLDEALEQAIADRACVLFTLLGPAGVGKSRLVHELLSSAVDRAQVVRGRCLPYGEGITYWPLAEVVKQAAQIHEMDTPEQARLAIARLCAGDERGESIAGHVAAAIGLAEESGMGDELFWAIRRFFELLAAERPLIVVFDDIHWAEPTFLDLIEHITDWSSDAPILLLCVARPELLELRPAWAGGKMRATTVLLQPLSEEDMASLIANLLGESVLAESVMRRVAEAAEGNPLFVEEFVAMLVDDGLVRQENGRWVPVGDLEQVTVPPTIRSLLAARIDRLAAPERRVIERASVVGKVFWRGAIAELAPEPMRPEVGPSLLGLVRKELVRPDRSDFAGDDAFRFRHLLIRDAAYDALPKQERVTLHERFAGWLERTAGDRVVEYEELLGYHLEQAFRYRSELGPLDEAASALGRRAAERLAAAGHRAADRGDASGARKMLERAATLLPTEDPLRLELLPDLGAVLAELGHFDQAVAVLDEAAERARHAGLESIRWRAAIRRETSTVFLNPEGAADRARAVAEAAIERLPEIGDDRGAAEALILLGDIEYYLGRLAAERSALTTAVEFATRAGDDRLELHARISRAASALWDDTPLSEIVADANMIYDRARATGRRLPEAQALGILGRALALQGQPEEGRRLVSESRAILRDLGRRVHAAGASHWAGMVEWAAGDYSAQEKVLRAGAEELVAVGDRGMLSTSYGDMAVALHHLGRLEEADALGRESQALTVSDDVVSQVGWRAARSRVLADMDGMDEALRLADEALALVDASEFALVSAWAREQVADVALRGRGPVAAVALLRQALAYFEPKEATGAAARLRARIAEVEAQGEAGEVASTA